MRDKPLRLLIVDDEPETRHAFSAFFARARMSVATASSAAEARDALSTFRPHVVISDLSMPEEDGFDVVRAVHEAAARCGDYVVTIALTGMRDPIVRKRAIGAGFDCYFVKPADPLALLQAIEALVPLDARRGAQLPPARWPRAAGLGRTALR